MSHASGAGAGCVQRRDGAQRQPVPAQRAEMSIPTWRACLTQQCRRRRRKQRYNLQLLFNSLGFRVWVSRRSTVCSPCFSVIFYLSNEQLVQVRFPAGLMPVRCIIFSPPFFEGGRGGCCFCSCVRDRSGSLPSLFSGSYKRRARPEGRRSPVLTATWKSLPIGMS